MPTCSPRTLTARARAGRAEQANSIEPLFSPIEQAAACNILDKGGALGEGDYGKFVQFFRQASPYIAGHRARTFVVVIPGDVVMQQDLLQALVSDIALLHGLGIRLVIVLGAAPIIDATLEQQGGSSVFVGGYRITDASALEAAVEAAGRSRTAVEQMLSRGPSVPVFRRHAKGEGEMHFGPALNVVGGNYVAAKRRGILNGVDFGYTGEVSKRQVAQHTYRTVAYLPIALCTHAVLLHAGCTSTLTTTKVVTKPPAGISICMIETQVVT